MIIAPGDLSFILLIESPAAEPARWLAYIQTVRLRNMGS